MLIDIFKQQRNWTYSQRQMVVQNHINHLIKGIQCQIPADFYSSIALVMIGKCFQQLRFLRSCPISALMKSIPKGALLNTHLVTNIDQQFIRNHLVHTPNLYISNDLSKLFIGTVLQAKEWISFDQLNLRCKDKSVLIQTLLETVILNKEESGTVLKEPRTLRNIIPIKLLNCAVIVEEITLFRELIKHIIKKHRDNGYLRIELRLKLFHLKQYNEQGKVIRTHTYDRIFDEISKIIEQQKNNWFTLGIIVCFGNEPIQQIREKLNIILQYKRQQIIGFDFYQQAEKIQGFEEKDRVLSEELLKYGERRYAKVYHAGETSKHTCATVERAVRCGAVRIGKGLNMLQRVQFLPQCRNIFFEKCLISNLARGFRNDPREASGPALLALGVPVGISCGDGGRFGCLDSTEDYVLSVLCCNLTLKHLKLMALLSIRHSLFDGKQAAFAHFDAQWEQWIGQLEVSTSGEKEMVNTSGEMDIFNATRNWDWTQNDQIANEKYSRLVENTAKQLPQNFYFSTALDDIEDTLCHLQFMRSTELYRVIKTQPKGVIHHLHIDCCQDQQFYTKYIIPHPNVYLTKDKQHFVVGSRAEALAEGWVSIPTLRQQLQSEQKLLRYLSNITMLSSEQLSRVAGNQSELWDLFQVKISNFFVFVHNIEFFRIYARYLMQKYIRNGYQRLQFRGLLVKLKQYDAEGNFVREHEEKAYMDVLDQAHAEVLKQYPYFSFGVVFFGLKFLPREANFQLLDKACSYEWKHMLGIDFVQQEDPYGSQEPYIEIGDTVLKKYPHLDLKKVYHAGQTKDHLNNNVELAVKAGAVRIGHGINISKRIDYLKNCRHVCFELNPISNLLTGGTKDIRQSTAPLLLGMGFAVSLSPDDPGKFGYEDCTVDHFVSALSFDWTLKHFKLLAYHSINHAIITEGHRLGMVDRFRDQWNKWVNEFLAQEQCK